MSPKKFDVDDDQHLRREINGSRPSPLKINKESHFIHKQPSSSSFSSSMSSLVSCVAAVPKQQQQQKQPVIIYTHSPKIIHTQARDFMALVQKLTGLSQSNEEEASAQKTGKGLKKEGNDHHNLIKSVKQEDNESSSALTEDNSGGGGGGGGNVRASSSSSLSPILNPSHPYFADIPLFTPNSANFFCSPRRVYRYPDSAYVSPNMGNSMSPSVLEFMKGLPEY